MVLGIIGVLLQAREVIVDRYFYFVSLPELSVELPLLPTYQVFMGPLFDLIRWQLFQGQ